jgi:integrase
MPTTEPCAVALVAPPDPLRVLKSLVLDAVSSPLTKRQYEIALGRFIEWTGGRTFCKPLVNQYRSHLEGRGFSPSTINQALSAIRRLGVEAADAGMLDPNVAAAVGRVKGVRREGRRTGNWLTKEQARALLSAPDSRTFTGKRDRALLAVLLGTGLRRNEARDLAMEHVQMRDARWCIVDLVGKQGKARTIPMAAWTKLAIDEWTAAAGIAEGRVFRPVRCNGTLAGDRLSPQTIFRIVLEHSGRVGVQIRPHDARRTFARLAFYGGSGMEQVSLSLGHSSVTVTERYIGVRLDLADAPCDHLGIGS